MPTKHRTVDPMGIVNCKSQVLYFRAKNAMFAYTDLEQAPWKVVCSDIKNRARPNHISHLLSMVIRTDPTPRPIEMEERWARHACIRPPIRNRAIVAAADDSGITLIAGK